MRQHPRQPSRLAFGSRLWVRAAARCTTALIISMLAMKSGEVLAASAHPATEKALLERASERPGTIWATREIGGGVLEGRQRLVRGHLSLTSAAGYRRGNSGAFLTFSASFFSDPIGDNCSFSVGHVGAGLERLWLEERVRTTIAAGTSILLSDTAVDERGSAGWFFSVRPAAFRWPVSPRWTVEFSPMMLEVSVPVTGGLPLVLANYSTAIGLEFRL